MKYLLITLLILTSCSKKKSSESIDESFDKNPVGPYENLSSIINDIIDTKLTVLKGLPHQDHKVEFQREKDKNIDIKRHGYHFYKEPISLKDEELKKLTTMIKSGKYFYKWSGYKKCGGFHPDFSLIWSAGNKEVEIHFCFGCDEIKAYSQDKASYCDMNSTIFKDIFGKHLKEEKAVKKIDESLK